MLGLGCPVAPGSLVPPPGMEPVFPALAGGFFTTESGKPLKLYFKNSILKIIIRSQNQESIHALLKPAYIHFFHKLQDI